MPLPIKPLPILERWSCHQCGICCRGSIVPLSESDLARLRDQGWAQHPDFQNLPPVVRQSWLGREFRLNHRPDGSCVFLDADGLCRIHKELGFDAKPLICRMFPLQVVPRDNAAYLTLRRACPSAAADKGTAVEEQLDFARRLAREHGLTDQPVAPPPLKPGESRDWPTTRRLLESVQRLLTDERYPPVRRLVHALAFCRLLERAKTRPLSEKQLAELFGVLAEGAPEEVSGLFADRQPPGHSAGLLFRQTAAEYVRLHPRYHVQPNWRERWRLAAAAFRFVRGRGHLPQLNPAFGQATFAQLEEPLGRMEPGLYMPFSRLIEANAVSWNYALSNRGRWSVVESLRMLALAYPIGLWLLRWASAGRQPTQEDVLDIITALDRGQGYHSLAGAKQRRRIQLLAGLDALEPLVVWYGR